MFLLDAPAADRLETGCLQEDEGIELCKQLRVIRAQALVDVAAPPPVRIPIGLELIDRLIEVFLRLGNAADTPALQDDQVDRSSDGGPRRFVDAVVGGLVEAR